MKSVRLVLISIAALAAGGVALAQDQTINDYVRELIGNLADPDEKTLVDEIKLTELGEADSDEFTFRVDPERSYMIYAACDDDCDDINLTVYDEDGEYIDSDDAEDSSPMLAIDGADAGEELTIEVSMITCNADVCVAGVGLYEIED